MMNKAFLNNEPNPILFMANYLLDANETTLEQHCLEERNKLKDEVEQYKKKYYESLRQIEELERRMEAIERQYKNSILTASDSLLTNPSFQPYLNSPPMTSIPSAQVNGFVKDQKPISVVQTSTPKKIPPISIKSLQKTATKPILNGSSTTRQAQVQSKLDLSEESSSEADSVLRFVPIEPKVVISKTTEESDSSSSSSSSSDSEDEEPEKKSEVNGDVVVKPVENFVIKFVENVVIKPCEDVEMKSSDEVSIKSSEGVEHTKPVMSVEKAGNICKSNDEARVIDVEIESKKDVENNTAKPLDPFEHDDKFKEREADVEMESEEIIFPNQITNDSIATSPKQLEKENEDIQQVNQQATFEMVLLPTPSVINIEILDKPSVIEVVKPADALSELINEIFCEEHSDDEALVIDESITNKSIADTVAMEIDETVKSFEYSINVAATTHENQEVEDVVKCLLENGFQTQNSSEIAGITDYDMIEKQLQAFEGKTNSDESKLSASGETPVAEVPEAINVDAEKVEETPVAEVQEVINADAEKVEETTVAKVLDVDAEKVGDNKKSKVVQDDDFEPDYEAESTDDDRVA